MAFRKMVNIRPLSAQLSKIAQKDLNEVPTRIESDIEHLRTWIQSHPDLNARTDDQFLVAFLRSCKYSLEKAKNKITCFYMSRQSIPELYENRLVDDTCIDLFRSGVFLRLPKPLEARYRVHCLRFGQYDTNKYNMKDLMKLNFMLSEINIREDDYEIVGGIHMIIDFDNVKPNAILQFDIGLTKKIVSLGDNAWPSRPKGFHFINASTTVRSIINIARGFMSKKMKSRVQIHADITSLYNYVPKDCLPAEYGGSNGTIEKILTEGELSLLSYKRYFEEDANYGVRSSNKKHTFESATESFRKLEID